MPIVLDSSMTMALSMDDEDVPDAEEFLAKLAQERAIVPSLWSYEIANSLVVAVRRGRILKENSETRLALILSLPVDVEEDQPAAQAAAIIRLALEHGLTAYDAAFVELAIRRNASLATLDDPMARAARAEGVEVFGS